MERSDHGFIEILSRHLPEGAEETTKLKLGSILGKRQSKHLLNESLVLPLCQTM
jgi:hypothetical protein